MISALQGGVGWLVFGVGMGVDNKSINDSGYCPVHPYHGTLFQFFIV